jgi:hypothetical protein
MLFGEIGGGLVRRWWCSNPNCSYSWHYSSWCPWEGTSPQRSAPLPPKQAQALAERQLEKMREAAKEDERARRIQNYTRNPNDPVPVTPKPSRYGWLWEAIPVVVVFALAMLVLVLAAVH